VVFAVIAERLQLAHAATFFNQVTPRIVGIFLLKCRADHH
jgi:fumarate reductase subunit C